MARRDGSSRGTPTGGALIVALLAGAIVLGGLWFVFRGGGQARSQTAGSATPAITLRDGEVLDAIDAQSRCESMIRGQLPSPDSAAFANRFSGDWQEPVLQGNSWRFVASVGYRGSSGAASHARFLCVLDGDANTITVQPMP